MAQKQNKNMKFNSGKTLHAIRNDLEVKQKTTISDRNVQEEPKKTHSGLSVVVALFEYDMHFINKFIMVLELPLLIFPLSYNLGPVMTCAIWRPPV